MQRGDKMRMSSLISYRGAYKMGLEKGRAEREKEILEIIDDARIICDAPACEVCKFIMALKSKILNK